MSEYIIRVPIVEDIDALEHQANLPHMGMICDDLRSGWGDTVADIICCHANECLTMEGRSPGIESVDSDFHLDEGGHLYLSLIFKVRKGYKKTASFCRAIDECVSAQITDGFGESYLDRSLVDDNGLAFSYTVG